MTPVIECLAVQESCRKQYPCAGNNQNFVILTLYFLYNVNYFYSLRLSVTIVIVYKCIYYVSYCILYFIYFRFYNLVENFKK